MSGWHGAKGVPGVPGRLFMSLGGGGKGPVQMVTSKEAGGLAGARWMVSGGRAFPPGSFFRSRSLLPRTLMVMIRLTGDPSSLSVPP